MSDALSQGEIDLLLRQISSGEIDVEEVRDSADKQVKNYDFARPSKFSKEHLRTLEIIFEHYGRLLSTNLPVYLRKNIQVEVMNSEAVTYLEFSNALSNPVLLGVVDFAPLRGDILMDLAAPLGYAIVDRMLGGMVVPMEKARDFSEIELLIIERIMNVCTNLLREPWQNVVDIYPGMTDENGELIDGPIEDWPEEPDYSPAILHYTGTPFKPWDCTYPGFLERFQKR